MRSLTIWIGFILLSISTISAQDILLNDETDVFRADVLNVFIDSSGEKEFSEISSESFQSNFNAVDASTPFPPGRDVHWFEFTLDNRSNYDQEWVFNFQNWSYVDLYFRADSLAFENRKTGHLVPYSKRDYPEGNRSLISVNLPAGSLITCYARLDPVFNNFQDPLNYKFSISPRGTHDQKIHNSNKLSYVFFGIYLVMLLYNLFIFISTRDRAYGFYLLTLLVMILEVSDNSGIIMDLFPNLDILPQILNIWNPIEPHLVTIALLLYVDAFLKIKDRFPVWHKAFRFMIYFVMFLGAIILINFDLGEKLAVLAAAPFIVMVFAVGIKSYRDKYPGSVYFLLGHTFWFMGGVTKMIGQVFPSDSQQDFVTFHAMALGSSLEMVLFSLALANTINHLRKENEQKQARIINQLQENAELQTKVTRELEDKVAERTQEITKQNEEIALQAKKLEEEKERSDRLLLNILPLETAEELKKTGHATPRFYENVSILFVDITKFSKMARDMSPNDIVQGSGLYFFRLRFHH